MKTLKIISLSLLLLSASCKKDQPAAPPAASKFNLRDYYITGKMNYTYNGQTVLIPYILYGNQNGSTVELSYGYSSDQGNYTYQDGILSITYVNGNKDKFKITNNTISDYIGTSSIQTYKVQPIPDQNMFSGNSYSGSFKTPGSLTAVLERIKFGDKQFGESSIGDPVLDLYYSSTLNVAGQGYNSNTDVFTFFVLQDGKLEVSRFSGPTNNLKMSYGTFTRQ
jgi:hypothetical protein